VPFDPDRLKRALGEARDGKLLELAVRRGLLSVEQRAELSAHGEGSARERLLARGWLTGADLDALEAELARDDFARPSPERAPELPEEARAAAALEGRLLSDYVLTAPLGRGGAGEVWKAWDRRLGRWVAIKIATLPAGSRTAADRFRREAMAAARLDHPNVLPVFHVGEDGGRPFIVMRLVEGRTLGESKLPLRRALEVMRAVAEAVQHAHERGVVHRDLKPANIMIEPRGERRASPDADHRGGVWGPSQGPHDKDDDDRVSVVDFGLVFVPEGSDRLTVPGDVLGTAAYMSPEQARGDARATQAPTDVYGLGATLYELATGRPPFEGQSFAEVVSRVANTDPTPPRKLVPTLPADVETVILTAMDKDPARRYPSAAAFAEDVARVLDDRPILARRMGPLARLGRQVRRSPRRAALLAGAGAAVAGAIALAAVGARRRAGALESMREMGALSLEAALQLRRAGDNAGMRRLLPRLRAAYELAARRAPELAEVDYFMGRVHRALIEDAEALAFQEKALAKDPGYAPALYEHAVLLSRSYGRQRERVVELGRTVEASPVLAEASEQDRISVEDVERAHPELPRLREAVLRDCVALERARAAGPGDSPFRVSEAMVLAARGLLAHHQGQHAEARGLLEKAVALDGLLEEAWEALAQSASAEGRWDEAERAYGEGIARDRGYLPHRLGRSRVYMIHASAHFADLPRARADYVAAIQDLDAALALDSRLAEGWLQRGLAHAYHGHAGELLGLDALADFDAGEKDLAQALRLGAPSVEAHHGRGMLYHYRAAFRMRTGGDPIPDADAAETEYGEVLRQRPEDPWPLLWKGRTSMLRALYRQLYGRDALADLTAAEQDLARAARLGPSRSQIWEWLGFATCERGQYLSEHGQDPSAAWATSEDAFAHALALPQPPTWPLVRRSVLWTRRGVHAAAHGGDPGPDFTHAAGDLARVLSLSPDLPYGWLRRGILHTERGVILARAGRNPAEAFAAAEADLDHTLALNPRHGEALVERARLRLERARWWRRTHAAAKAAVDHAAAERDLGEAVRINPGYTRRRDELLAARDAL
jgi:serine/threonine-protein kinase